MPRVRRWRDLAPGLLTLAAVGALVLGVLGFARIGALRGDTIRLVVLAGSARDVLEGTEVWIAGQKVGAVRSVELRPIGTDTTRRIALTLDVLTTARPQLRRGTRAQLRTGGSLLGAPVVALFGGAATDPLLRDGDTLLALPQLDRQSVTGRFAGAGEHVGPLRQNVVRIVDHLRRADRVIDAGTRGAGLASLGAAVSRVRTAAAGLRGGPLNRLLDANDPVRRRVVQAAARADSIGRLLDTPTGTVGRFRRDSTLAGQIAEVRTEVARLRVLVDEPAGTVGRARHDAQLARELGALEARLGALSADVRDRPLRYIVF